MFCLSGEISDDIYVNVQNVEILGGSNVVDKSLLATEQGYQVDE